MLTVLIVDDDEEVRQSAMRALAAPHLKLASAANGRLALAQAQLLKPDIVICDVNMPELGGFEVLAQLKSDPQLAGVQVMMLTGFASRHAVRLGMSLGADDYLTKPFLPEELVEAVQGLARRRERLLALQGAAPLVNAGPADAAARDALNQTLATLHRGVFAAGAAPLVVEGFHVLRRLGAGATSTIFLARDGASGDLVVLKVLALDPGAPDLTARFMREFSLLSTVRHPHVIRIVNQGFGEDLAYIAMEYFENGDLRSRLHGPMPAPAALAVVTQVAGALEAIHAVGIVHRDIKPENLMVRANGDMVLADFGIAKPTAGARAGQPTLTAHGEMIGSPSYMSPEQIFGDAVSARSDLYSLGILFHELLTGERPYRGESLLDLLAQHASASAPRLPPHAAFLQPVVDRLLAKKPAERYRSAGDLLADLHSLNPGGQHG